MGKESKQWLTLFFGASKSLQMVTATMKIKRRLLLGRKIMTNLDNILKSRDITLSTEVHLVQAMVFSVVMYGCESWTMKKIERQRIDTLGCWRRLLSLLDWKEIQSIHPKGDQSWVFIGRTDVEVETPVVWPLDMKSWFIWKDALKDSRQDDKGTRGWDGWMASPTQWTWVWVNSRSWWWTGRPCVLLSMRS